MGGPITIRYADGTTQKVKPGHFARRKQAKTPRGRWKLHLRSDYWKALRRRALERDGHRCAICRGDDRLEVHHLTYVRLPRERLEDVIVLCRYCHTKEHLWQRRERQARGSR